MRLENRGRRVLLRWPRPEDAGWLGALYADGAFARLFCSSLAPAPESDVRAMLERRARATPAELGFAEFVAELDGRPVGLASLGGYAPQHRRAELLVGIQDERLRGTTVALEASLLLMDLAFNDYGLHKLFSYVYGYNVYAQRNTLKLGFRQEGLLREHHWLEAEGRWVDLFVNGLTEGEFRSSVPLSRWSGRFLGRDVTRPVPVVRVGEVGVPVALSAAEAQGLALALQHPGDGRGSGED